MNRPPLVLRSRWLEAPASVAVVLTIAGGAAAAGVCWPFAFGLQPGQPVWWLQILALLPLLRVLQGCRSAKQAFGWAALFSTAWLCATFWWLYIAMNTYGGLPSLLSVLGVLALAGALGLYYAGAAAVFWWLGDAKPAQRSIAFAALWTMAEMARGTWLTGFGWGAMAYAHTDGPLAFWVPLVGAYGVGAIAVWCAASLAVLDKTGGWHKALLVLLLLVGLLSPGWQATHATGTLTVTLLQGNIPQNEKFESGTGIPASLAWYAEKMRSGDTDLILAPETAIPQLPQELPPNYWEGLTQHIRLGRSALITGIPLGDYTLGYTNSVLALKPDSLEAWRYDKHHLVPFGEFIPPLFKWFTRMMHIPLGDFNRGDIGQPSFAWMGQRIAPNICYEDLFGEELGARFINPALAPTVFANVSNLGWFGNSTAIDQHLQISRMRALEFQRPFLRATNTGATVIMDHRGHVQAALPRLTQGVLVGVVEGRDGITPFAWWVARFGLWPLWIVSLLLVVAVAWWSRTARSAARANRPFDAPAGP